jgi:TRAP-type mannitol/chloroaromatic compound transport system permease small subunit
MGLASFENGVNRFSRWCNWLSCAAVLVMMCVVCGNVVLRFFDAPILGTYEYVELISAVIISFGLAHTGVVKGHVAVDLVMRRFSERVQAAVGAVITTIALGVFVVVTWRLAQFGYQNYRLELATETMDIPLFPFNFMIAFGFLVLLLVLISELIQSILKAVKK